MQMGLVKSNATQTVKAKKKSANSLMTFAPLGLIGAALVTRSIALAALGAGAYYFMRRK